MEPVMPLTLPGSICTACSILAILAAVARLISMVLVFVEAKRKINSRDGLNNIRPQINCLPSALKGSPLARYLDEHPRGSNRFQPDRNRRALLVGLRTPRLFFRLITRAVAVATIVPLQ